MGVKVAKFGGSSLADAVQLEKVRRIIEQDGERRYIVVSAPGRRFSEERKATDCLYLCSKYRAQGVGWHREYRRVADRLLASEVNLEIERERRTGRDGRLGGAVFQGLWDTELMRRTELTERLLEADCSEDFAASRGEYLSALLAASYMGFDFVDSDRLVLFDGDGRLRLAESLCAIREALEGHERAVIPGFYGTGPDGKIKTFSRGGSDITGALVAAAVGACVYENWTDVPGVLMADPRIVDNPRTVPKISYDDLRELSRMGACVLHEDAIYPARIHEIPINIRNTNEPEHCGTVIFEEAGEVPGCEGAAEGDCDGHGCCDGDGCGKGYDDGREISGIAGSKGFGEISVRPAQVCGEEGFSALCRLREMLREYGLREEIVRYSFDRLSLVYRRGGSAERAADFAEAVRQSGHFTHVKECGGLGLVTVVGKAAAKDGSALLAALGALAGSEARILFAEKSHHSRSLILGVCEEQVENAVKIIYNAII